MFIKGKNPIKFNSKPTHIVSQCGDDNVVIVPIIIIKINRKFEGKNLLFIKGRTIWVAQNKVSSFILILLPLCNYKGALHLSMSRNHIWLINSCKELKINLSVWLQVIFSI